MFKYLLVIKYFNIDRALFPLELNPIEVLILQNLTLKTVQTMVPSTLLTKHSLFHIQKSCHLGSNENLRAFNPVSSFCRERK